jgi:hypothetical protein
MPSRRSRPTVSDILLYREALLAAQQAFNQAAADAAAKADAEAVAAHFNALIRFFLSVGDIQDEFGFEPGRDDFVQWLVRILGTPREIEASELRAIATGVAYKHKARLLSSGPKDSALEAAMQYVAALEGSELADASEAIRKSNQRLRKKVRGTYFLRLDREKMTVSAIDAEDCIFRDLPRKRGRPRKVE